MRDGLRPTFGHCATAGAAPSRAAGGSPLAVRRWRSLLEAWGRMARGDARGWWEDVAHQPEGI
jgi:hypothetical protein